MANASFTAFKNGLPQAQYNLTTAAIKVALVSGYTFNAAHTTMADITANGGVINATSSALTNPTMSGGVFDADDTTITTSSSASAHVLIVFQASAVTGGADVAAASQKLMLFLDTGTNLPITPGAGTVTVTWPNTSGKIYKVG